MVTTIAEEVGQHPILRAPEHLLEAYQVSIILPQQWNRGKTLYVVIRHGMLVAIALQLTGE